MFRSATQSSFHRGNQSLTCRGIAGLANDDPNDAGNVNGGDGDQEDGALLLGGQVAQGSKQHATDALSYVTDRLMWDTSCGTRGCRFRENQGDDPSECLTRPSQIALHNLLFYPLRRSFPSIETTKPCSC